VVVVVQVVVVVLVGVCAPVDISIYRFSHRHWVGGWRGGICLRACERAHLLTAASRGGRAVNL